MGWETAIQLQRSIWCTVSCYRKRKKTQMVDEGVPVSCVARRIIIPVLGSWLVKTLKHIMRDDVIC